MKEIASIGIKYSTYERLKSFCTDNGLKITDIATKLIHEGLMREMYGDIPYGKIKDPFGIIAIPEDSGDGGNQIDKNEQNVENAVEPLEKWTEIVAKASNDKRNSFGEIIEDDEVIKMGSDMPVDTQIKKGRGKRILK